MVDANTPQEEPKVACVMCQGAFERKDVDFLGRCDKCFHDYMQLPDDKKPKLGVPFSPIYNGKAKYGF